PGEGATPNALALSADGSRLFVAEADANAVAVFDLSAATAGTANAKGNDRLTGRIPAGWYPTGVAVAGDTVFALNGKGRGSAPNPLGPDPLNARDRQGGPGSQYTLRMLHGTITVSTTANARGSELAQLSARVVRANGWDKPRAAGGMKY